MRCGLWGYMLVRCKRTRLLANQDKPGPKFRSRCFTFFDHPTIQNTLFSNQGILYQMLQDHNIALNRCKELIHRIDMELQLVPTKAKQEASNQ